MNLVTHEVIEVLGTPRKVEVEDKTWWRVDVLVDSYGRQVKDTVSAKTEEEILAITRGYKYEA